MTVVLSVVVLLAVLLLTVVLLFVVLSVVVLLAVVLVLSAKYEQILESPFLVLDYIHRMSFVHCLDSFLSDDRSAPGGSLQSWLMRISVHCQFLHHKETSQQSSTVSTSFHYTDQDHERLQTSQDWERPY